MIGSERSPILLVEGARARLLRDERRLEVPRRREAAPGEQGLAARGRLHAQGALPSAASARRGGSTARRRSSSTLDRGLLAGLTERLERRMAFALSVADRHLFVTIAGATLDGAVRRLVIGEG